MQKNYEPAPAGKHWKFVAYITKNGRRVYAYEYGLKAFRILVDD